MSCGCWPVGVLHAYLPTSVPGERLEVSSCGVASQSRVHAPITAWHVVIEQAWALRPQYGTLRTKSLQPTRGPLAVMSSPVLITGGPSGDWASWSWGRPDRVVTVPV